MQQRLLPEVRHVEQLCCSRKVERLPKESAHLSIAETTMPSASAILVLAAPTIARTSCARD